MFKYLSDRIKKIRLKHFLQSSKFSIRQLTGFLDMLDQLDNPLYV